MEAAKGNSRFKKGLRVRVKSKWVDMHPFFGEEGVVVRNSGKYLGIIVQFENPPRWMRESRKPPFEWNFNARDLAFVQFTEADYFAQFGG